MIELNADIGEGHDDDALMPYLARASIACGGHCGDAASMRAALRRCAEHGVAAGAHPSYPDRAGFGRR
ncbi:MAG: LamB/YcsF family protein, partial [Thiobacillus sp.]